MIGALLTTCLALAFAPQGIPPDPLHAHTAAPGDRLRPPAPPDPDADMLRDLELLEKLDLLDDLELFDDGR